MATHDSEGNTIKFERFQLKACDPWAAGVSFRCCGPGSRSGGFPVPGLSGIVKFAEGA